MFQKAMNEVLCLKPMLSMEINAFWYNLCTTNLHNNGNISLSSECKNDGIIGRLNENQPRKNPITKRSR